MMRPTPLPDGELTIPYYTVADIETRPDGSVLAIGLLWREPDACDFDYLTLPDWSAFTAFIRRSCRSRVCLRTIYAHNGGAFDWVSYADFLTRSNAAACTIHQQGSGAVCIEVDFGKHLPRIRLLDSFRLVKLSLKGFCDAMATDVRKIDLEGRMPYDVYQSDRHLFDAYLKSDCLSLSLAIRRVHDTINTVAPVRKLGMTLASTALKMFKTNFMNDYIMTPRNPHQKLMARRSYTGGRVEAIKTGMFDHVWGYDVNSLYPSVMKSIDVPVSYQSYWTYRYDGKPGLYDVTYMQPANQLHPLLRDEQSGEFQYAGSGVYTHMEVDRLLALGGDIHLKRGLVFRRTARLFGGYVDTLYGARLRARSVGNTALDVACKFFLNSLYGKFGEKPIRTSLVQMTYHEAIALLKQGKTITPYGDIWAVQEPAILEHEFVAIASFITSAARLRLFDLLQVAGDDAVYCDTDSVYSTSEMPDTLVSDELGAIKLEYQGKMAVWGKKAYAKITERGIAAKVKGIPKAGLSGFGLGDVALLLSGVPIMSEYGTASTLHETIGGDLDPCRWYPRHRTTRLLTPGRRGHLGPYAVHPSNMTLKPLTVQRTALAE